MTRPRSCRHRALVLVVVALLTLAAAGCRQVDQLIQTAPRVLAPGGNADGGPRPARTNRAATVPDPAELPPGEPTPGFTWEALDPGADGRLRFKVTILPGGSPNAVADAKLTPLFEADGKNAVQYVSDAYFAANPGRTPQSIQPGDEFVLTLPADAFVVHASEDRTEDLGRPVRVRAYVSVRGDRLRYYLTDPFPLHSEIEPADGGGTASIRLHPELSWMLGTGRVDAPGLARLVYRVPDPDLYQVESMRKLAAEVKPGESKLIAVDRTRTYLDPIRQAMTEAAGTEPVDEPGRDHLTRAVFERGQDTPYVAIEDSLGARTDVAELPAGQVFRIAYHRDGTVRVAYKTGADDARGKRDPALLRENVRWAGLYDRLAGDDAAPVAWGLGEPSDLDPFPTARDPNRRVLDGDRSYDYLVPGRIIQVTFRPTRTQADARAQAEFREALKQLRDAYYDDLVGLIGALVR